MKIILGSSSIWRKAILKTIIPDREFEVINPDVDEKSIRSDNPHILTTKLAIVKCKAVRKLVHEPAVVITSDQVVTYKGAIREKPESSEQAREFLESYRIAPATCVTAVHALNTETHWAGMIVDEATVWFKNLNDYAIKRIIDEGIIFSCAGGFAAGHKSFKPYVRNIEGELESVMGLPKALTTELIANAMKE